MDVLAFKEITLISGESYRLHSKEFFRIDGGGLVRNVVVLDMPEDEIHNKDTFVLVLCLEARVKLLLCRSLIANCESIGVPKSYNASKKAYVI